jgi:hypothetical protein
VYVQLALGDETFKSERITLSTNLPTLASTTPGFTTARILHAELKNSTPFVVNLRGPKREEVAGSWRKLHDEELHILCSSSNIIRLDKLRARWVGNIACWERSNLSTTFWLENLKGGDLLENFGIDGRIILKWMKKQC